MRTEERNTRTLRGTSRRIRVTRFSAPVIAATVLLGMTSCAAGLHQSDSAIDRHLDGSAGVQQACVQAKMTACDELKKSFERFVLTDFGTARKHIRSVLAKNKGIEMQSVTRTLEIAARIAGKQGNTVQQFSAFLSGVIEGNSDNVQVPEEKTAAQNTEMPVGCAYDAQCKFDRVCINGECVSARYREEVEELYMATTRGIVAPETTASPSAAEETEAGTELRLAASPSVEGMMAAEMELELLSSPLGRETMLCTPEDVKECMQQCEKGSSLNCYAVAKLYERLPESEQNTDYMRFAYQKACAFGLNDACIDLGNQYFYGRFGDQNMELTYRYNFNACAQGNGIGCVNTARLLKSGKGVSQNSALADKYYIKACEYGQNEYCVANTGVEVVADADAIAMATANNSSSDAVDQTDFSPSEKRNRRNGKRTGNKKKKNTSLSESSRE